MGLGIAFSLVFLGFWCVALQTASPALERLLWTNGLVQLTWFLAAAIIPFRRTGRVSWVDLAWPFGVAFIGVQILILGDGTLMRRAIVAAVYLFIGLRMGALAVHLIRTTGVALRWELPRYQYRRLLLERAGSRHVDAHLTGEILAQCLANASVLAMPGFLMGINTTEHVSGWEIAGLCLWAAAYAIETVADFQKQAFIARSPSDAVCDVGLWRYSRHPNYFGEWLVWTGLVIATVPSWWTHRGVESSAAVWVTLGVAALTASTAMYTTLVYVTGAIPAEFYSVQKRPGYRAYQERTSRFLPWRPRA